MNSANPVSPAAAAQPNASADPAAPQIAARALAAPAHAAAPGRLGWHVAALTALVAAIVVLRAGEAAPSSHYVLSDTIETVAP